MLKGRRYGNVIIAGSDIPFGDDPQLVRALLGGAVPAQLWAVRKWQSFPEALPFCKTRQRIRIVSPIVVTCQQVLYYIRKRTVMGDRKGPGGSRLR